MSKPTVVFVGPELGSQGGIVSVNKAWMASAALDPHSSPLEIVYYASTRDGSKLDRLAYAARRLARFVLTPRRRPWSLHVHMGAHGAFWRKAAYVWAGRWKGGRVVIHVHPSAFVDYYERGGGFLRRAVRRTLSQADGLIALTTSMKTSLQSIASRPWCEVIPNPVSPSFPVVSGPRDEATIAFVGWLVPHKGVFDLVEAVARLRALHPRLRLIFAGSKDDGRLRAAVAASGLSDVTEFPGWLEPADVSRLLSRATVLALPSHTEGMPMVLLEALASGTPIVATTVGGVPDVLIHERNAILVAPRNVAALTAALDRVLRDPSLRSAMSDANRSSAQAFDGETIAARVRDLHLRLLGVEDASK